MSGSRFAASVAACASMLAAAGPGLAQTVNNVSGMSSPAEGTASAYFELVFGTVTSYDGQPLMVAGPFSGPLNQSGYYAVGDSPCDRAGGIAGCVSGSLPGDGKIQPLLAGTVTIGPGAGGACDGDETLAATVMLSAATRAFSCGPGCFGEESWSDNELTFNLAPTSVSSATPNGTGCDYVLASAGFPGLLTANGGLNEFGDDLDIGINSGQVQYDAPSAVGAATFETNANQGALMTVTTGPGYSCAQSFGPCEPGGVHHQTTAGMEGSRGDGLENTLWSVSVDVSGHIDSATVLTVNEGLIFGMPSWDASVWRLSGTCDSGCPAGDSDPTGGGEDPPDGGTTVPGDDGVSLQTICLVPPSQDLANVKGQQNSKAPVRTGDLPNPAAERLVQMGLATEGACP
jgi:hypothetical protein